MIDDIIFIKYLSIIRNYKFKSCIHTTTHSFGNSNICVNYRTIFIKNNQRYKLNCILIILYQHKQISTNNINIVNEFNPFFDLSIIR
jgi:hypothetical protein